MNNSILTHHPWKLFLACAIGLFVAQVVASTAGSYFNWSKDYGPYPTLRFALMTLVLWTYPYFAGRALSQHTPGAPKRILAVILLAILNNLLSVYLTETYGPIWYVVLITVIVNTYCLFAVIAFPARSLRTLELGYTPMLTEYWREFFQFMFWPLFVWWLQPRIGQQVIQRETANPR